MPLKIVLTTHGSTGDIYPVIRLAVALQEAGHTVRFATSEPFRAEVETAGVPFFQIPPNWSQSDLRYWMGRMQKLKSPVSQLRELYKAAAPHMEEVIEGMDRALDGADCLVSSYLFPMNRAIAERRGIPFVSLAFAHNSVPSRYMPPHGLPRLRGAPRWLQLRWNRFAWKLGNVIVDTAINSTISRQLKRKGLAPVKDFFSKSADLVLVTVSPGLMRPNIELHPRFQFSGYLRWQSQEKPETDQRILAFCGQKQVPIITFGSMVYDYPERYINRLVACWPQDKQLIVQPGWSGFKIPADAPHILQVEQMSHDQLLPHASVVIHHGGAGTTASVLYAGKPHIVVPHIGDQFFFGDEIKRLRCGLRLEKERWPEKLASRVATIEANPEFQTNATRHQTTLAQEDGPTEAVRQIEAFVAGQKNAQLP